MKVCLFGAGGKVGAVLGPALERGRPRGRRRPSRGPRDGCDVAVDFTRPDAVLGERRALRSPPAFPCVIGTTGFDLEALDRRGTRGGRARASTPRTSPLGAVLMMRFAEEAARAFPRAEIVELHADTKLDAPSGTAKATAARMGGDVPIHSVRLPGLVAHQEVILGGPGETLTIRHDTTSREAFVPGVLRALEAVRALPPGLTVGLEALLS